MYIVLAVQAELDRQVKRYRWFAWTKSNCNPTSKGCSNVNCLKRWFPVLSLTAMPNRNLSRMAEVDNLDADSLEAAPAANLHPKDKADPIQVQPRRAAAELEVLNLLQLAGLQDEDVNL